MKAGFEPSFVALSLFPQVVATMADQIALTTLLGQSFTSDRTAVFDSIQRLRQQARNVGTLKSSPQQEVETKTTSAGQEVIVIEPTNPQIVYVPQYNTEVVYTQAPTTTVVVQENNDAGVAVAAGLIGFTAGIAIGAAMDNNYYYGPYGWRGGAYMYNDAWDDYYDHREDARDDWRTIGRISSRSAAIAWRTDREQRTDRLESTQEQRTDRQQNRQENRPESQAQGAQRSTQAQGAQRRPGSGAAAQGATTQARRRRHNAQIAPEARKLAVTAAVARVRPASSTEQRRFGRILGILERGIATFLQRSRAAKPQQLARRRWRRTSSMIGASERRS